MYRLSIDHHSDIYPEILSSAELSNLCVRNDTVPLDALSALVVSITIQEFSCDKGLSEFLTVDSRIPAFWSKKVLPLI